MNPELQEPVADDLLVDAPVTNLRRSATSGAVLIGGSQLVRLISQFASVIVIARLIGPEQTGIAAMVAPLLSLALLFQDLGLGQATVQTRSITNAQINGLFWVGMGVSIVIAALVAGSAPFVADFYRTPAVLNLTLAVALLTILSNAGAQPMALLNRAMRFGTIAMIEIAAAVGSLAGSVVVAIATHSYWAIYTSNLLTVVITTLGAGALARWRPHRPEIVANIRPLIGFGAGASIFNLTLLVARNLDNVLIGRVWGDVAVGLYDRGYKLLLFPLQQAFQPIARVMLPVLSRLNDEPERYRSAFLRCQQVTLLAVHPGIVVLVMFAPGLIAALLGPAWAGTADIFRALGPAGLMLAFMSPGMWLFSSQGRTGELAKWGVFNAVTTVIGFAFSIAHGPLVLAMVYSATELVRAPLFWLYVTRKGPVRGRDAFWNVLPLFAALPLYAGAAWLVGHFLPAPVLVQIAAAAALAYLVGAGALAATRGGRALLGELGRMLGGGADALRRRIRTAS